MPRPMTFKSLEPDRSTWWSPHHQGDEVIVHPTTIEPPPATGSYEDLIELGDVARAVKAVGWSEIEDLMRHPSDEVNEAAGLNNGLFGGDVIARPLRHIANTPADAAAFVADDLPLEFVAFAQKWLRSIGVGPRHELFGGIPDTAEDFERSVIYSGCLAVDVIGPVHDATFAAKYWYDRARPTHFIDGRYGHPMHGAYPGMHPTGSEASAVVLATTHDVTRGSRVWGELFLAAWQLGAFRIIPGVHYYSDITAGCQLADAGVVEWLPEQMAARHNADPAVVRRTVHAMNPDWLDTSGERKPA